MPRSLSDAYDGVMKALAPQPGCQESRNPNARLRAMKPRRLGDISLARILEREEPAFVATQLIPNATREALAPYRQWLEPRALDPKTGLLILPIQTYVVRTRHHNILIDACLGEDKTTRWHLPWHKMKGLHVPARPGRAGPGARRTSTT